MPRAAYCDPCNMGLLCLEQCVQIVPFKTSKVPLKVLLLHGNFDIWVKEAKNLPNMDLFHSKLGDIFRRLPQNVCSKIEESMSDKITSDPYVTISVSDAVIGRTFVISNSENPVWMQHFYVPVAHYTAEVHFVVKDSDVIGSQIIGAVGIPIEQLFSGEKVEGTFPILNACGKPCKAGAVLNLSIQYTPMDRVSLYQGGVGSGPEYSGVPGTYFPLRRGGEVTLYQDAHVGDGCMPDVRLDRGLQYVHGDCWSDIYEAIKQARRLIYIIGWSVDHSVQLVRDDVGEVKDSSLGELLKNKSQEGVRVLLLVWDDPTSWSILGYKTKLKLENSVFRMENAEPMEEWQDDLSVQLLPFLNSKKPMKVMLLHGNLDIWVKDAKNLPNMDFDFSIGMSNTWLGGSKGKKTNKETSDPYVTISVANAVIGRTFVIDNSEHPVWMQHFYVPVAHYAAEVHFVIKDDDLVGSQILGLVGIPVEQICYGKKLEGTYPVLNASGKPCKAGAVLTLSIQYIPIHKIPIYQGGLGSGSEYQGVPGTYFPLRRGGRIKLYQDAHVPCGCLPHLNLDNDAEYVHGTCWRDIYEAIGQARTLVYITGWSIYHSVRLIRDDVNITDSSLGDLLKRKSQVGVRVLLLIWDDPTSTKMWGYKTDGIMQTGDEETRRFFKHSSVQVLLCPRSAGEGHSWAKKKEVGTIYTHHQKTVIVDADAGNYKRKIIAFVGGLDLCVGRYDTPRHPIFSSLQTVHKDDYHNPNYTGPTTGCPREPWHDLHSRVEGPAAYDVLTNFEERWLKASKPRGLKKMKTSSDDSLLKIERIPDILRIDDAECVTEDDPEGWHVQVFRSIDTNSVRGFPKDPKDAPSRNLVCGKNVLIDMSIHTAYVKAIRAAQHFIYIENQYFLGSSYNWNSYKTLGANNLIPMEIALKIANKIKANERFCAYIVIPMWPEGSPTSTATQRILFWQHNTMQMMYEVIYKALEEMGLEKEQEPQDYLNFFCLGNREVQGSEATSNGENTNSAATPQALSRKNRRFMIYVHSKGMIVDDEFVILGSANINQRSLEGTRDTEIAMGAYQPHHTWGRKGGSPHGQIYGYRMSLWAEHIGRVEECFERPESLECVRRVRGVGEQNWSQFAADEITDMKGHLLKYPVEVDRTGKVKPLPGCPTFPDVGGTIVGTFTAIQENLTI